MASGPSYIVPKYLPALFDAGTPAALSDHELVARFAARRGEHDEVVEAAFAVLVSRHGRMVLQVCRAVLGDHHDAEDAFPGDVCGNFHRFSLT